MRRIKDRKVVDEVHLPPVAPRKPAIITHVYVSQINMVNNVCQCLLWFSYGYGQLLFARDGEGNCQFPAEWDAEGAWH